MTYNVFGGTLNPTLLLTQTHNYLVFNDQFPCSSTSDGGIPPKVWNESFGDADVVLFTGLQMSFPMPNQQCQSTEGMKTVRKLATNYKQRSITFQ